MRRFVDKITAMGVVVTTNPEVMHGTPCFAGTRVPVQTLFDYFETGHSVEEFVDDFPSVSREKVIALLEDLKLHAVQTATAITA
jgi:uncharacterized protein (DUF433 family)